MTRRGVLGLLVVGLTTASCTADAPSSSQPRDDDATAAAVICTELRDQVNTLVDIANAAVADIGGLTPAERTASILAGYDDALAAADAFAADVAAWEVPEIPERDRLIAEVGDGARAAIAAYDRLELQRAFLDEPACRHVIQPFVVDG